MKEKTKTLQQIAEIANINLDTLRVYLSRPEFTKYLRNEKINNRHKNVFVFNKSFRQELCNFLELKRKFGCAKLLKDYKEGEEKMTRYLFEENADLMEENKRLKESLDLAIKQHEVLVKKYHEVLKLAKESADSNEFCLQELEKENEKLKKTLVDCGFWRQDGTYEEDMQEVELDTL